jgi:glutaredoxin
MKQVILYTRDKCKLCDVMKAQLDEIRIQNPFDLQIFDIDKDPALRARYHEEVPVLTIDGEKIAKYRLDPAMLLRRLAEPAA